MAGITAKDIATKLGLSPAAVSLALNGKPGVSDATRALVLETAMQLGYTRLDSATYPPANRTICFVRYADKIVTIAEHSSFSSLVLQGIEARSSELGYSTQVRYLYAGDMYNRQTLDTLRNVDGIIFLGTDITEPRLPELEQLFESLESTPVVIVDNFLLANRVDCVGNDCFGGARSAVEHLIKTGHRRIGYVKANQRIRNFDEREAGIHAALSQAGLELALTVEVGVSSENAFQDFDAWVKQGLPLPDALFAENDILAAAAIRVLKKHGYQVPEDISVVGFDDTPMCEMLDPPLSTVRCFKEDLGAVAVEHLHRRISANQVPHKSYSLGLLNTKLSTRFISRFSVKSRHE